MTWDWKRQLRAAMKNASRIQKPRQLMLHAEIMAVACGAIGIGRIKTISGMKRRETVKGNIVKRQIVLAAMTAATVSVLSMTFPLGTKAREDDIDEWRCYIEDVCSNYNICPEFVEAVIEAESGWDADAVNGTCVGLMQIDAQWHAERMKKLDATDLYDPYDNILIGIDYLGELFERYEDAAYVLMVYNGDSDVGTYAETGVMSEYAAGILERSAELERMNGK